jgi:hypothetical protein
MTATAPVASDAAPLSEIAARTIEERREQGLGPTVTSEPVLRAVARLVVEANQQAARMA